MNDIFILFGSIVFTIGVMMVIIEYTIIMIPFYLLLFYYLLGVLFEKEEKENER